jgi:flagellin
VGVNSDGMVTLDVAGGVGSAVFKESGATDGLASYLTGGNGGVVGGGKEVINSGGHMVLGGAYNTALLATSKTPAGSITLAKSGTAVAAGDQLSLNLTDTQGNTFKVTTAALAAGDGATQIATALNTALGLLTDKTAGSYVASGSGTNLTIKRTDGVDFNVQLSSTDAAAGAVTFAGTLTADSTSATALVADGVVARSAQQVQTFGLGATRMGAGDGKTTDVRGFTLTSIVAADNYAFDGYSKAVTAADVTGGINTYLQSYVSGYNNRAESKYVAAVDQSGNGVTFTAKLSGAVASAAQTTITGAHGTNKTAVVGAEGTSYNLENQLTIKLGNSDAVTLNVADKDFEYKSLSDLAAKVQSSIDGNVNFQGNNRVVVGVRYDEQTKTSGLTFTQAGGQTMQVSGSFISGELKADTTKTIISNISGGVDLSANNTVSVSVANADTGATITKNITLASTSKNVSMADYASLLQTGINAAFGNDGYSVAASSSNGQFSLGLNQTGAKTITLSGASVTAALGSSVSATGSNPNSMNSMSDVAAEISKDLAAVGAKASYDAKSGKLSLEVTGGDAGANSSISLSGAGLTALQMTASSAAGTVGNATASKLADVNVLTTAAATSALGSIDNSIEYVSKQRSLLGAIENRLAHTVNNLTNIVTNTEASRSAIEDTDYSKETTALAKQQILTQAATAMLAQANQSSQSVLSLLK